MRTILNFVISLSLLAGIAGCGSEDASDSPGPAVVASTTVVADLARNVAWERADVTGVLAANADPHDYEPKPSDAEAIAETDLVIESGGDLDAWMDDLVESAGTDAPVIELIDAVATIEVAGETDPHWWQDPRNAVSAVEAIRDELIAVDPDGRSTYEGNARAYVREIEDLDRRIAACWDRLPADARKLVTAHDALGYYAQRYGIEIVGSTIPALTTQAQPSAGETAELVDLILAEDVQAVFPEVGVSAALEEAVAAETGARIGGELYADTLGPDGSPADTYLGALATNTETLVDGLSGGRVACEG
jgi:ABC-type Zn uptake system ZnuABC Zn-binding protein ZnuA